MDEMDLAGILITDSEIWSTLPWLASFKLHRLRDRSLTCKGACCKNYLSRKIFGAPFRPQKKKKKKIGAPLFAMKITGQPHRKACKLNHGKFVVIFFQGPPYKGQKF